MINPQWGFNPIIIRMLFAVTSFQQDADALDKWLNMLEGYFFVHQFSDRENITFTLLKYVPMSNISGKLIGSKVQQKSLEYMGSIPLGIFLWMW